MRRMGSDYEAWVPGGLISKDRIDRNTMSGKPASATLRCYQVAQKGGAIVDVGRVMYGRTHHTGGHFQFACKSLT